MKRRWRTLAEFTVPGRRGSERQAMDRVAQSVAGLRLAAESLERLRAAVAEAIQAASKHGGESRPEPPITIRVLASSEQRPLSWQSTAPARAKTVAMPDAGASDRSAEPASAAAARGWGFFLVRKMAEDGRGPGDEALGTVEVLLYPGEGKVVL